MANIRLKKIILDIVENQLKDNDPPVTKLAYQKLLDVGYFMAEAKEIIGAVVLTEIYDVLKENQPYDEKRFAQALEEMVRQSINFEDAHTIPTEWDEWDELVQYGYEVQDTSNDEALIDYWWKAWEVFKAIISQAKEKMSVSGLMEE